MINNLKPYPAYRSYELPWLTEVPESWRVLRAKNVFSVIDVRSETGSEELLTVSSADGVVPRSQKTVTMFKAESYIGHKLCWPVDLVINSLWAWMQGLGFARHHGLVSSAYGVYRPRPMFREYVIYLHYLLRSAAYKWELQSRSKGVWLSRLQLSDPAFLDMPIIVPPAEEQSAIIRFLTSSDQGISQFIQAKLRLIDLLEVQKQAIIDRLVTYGVNPSASLKPSGIEWIGDLPKHWDTMRLKRGTTPIEQGWSPQCDAQPAGDNEWGVLKVGCVNKDYFDGGQNKRLPDFLEPRPALEVCDGDILVSRANTRELLGLAALAVAPRRKLLLCDKLFRFRPLPQRFDSRFLVHSIRCRSSRAQIESSANGASDSMQNIGQNVIKNLWLAAPPVHEQQEIVDAISVETDEIRRVIARTEREINLVREYRTRLIADVVTGRLDVRQAAAKLHDVPEEIPTSDVAEGLEEEVSLEAVEAES